MAYVTDGLQVYLDVKDYSSSSTSTTWLDESGKGNNGILTGFALDKTTSGWTNSGLVFDGTDDKVTSSFPNPPYTGIDCWGSTTEICTKLVLDNAEWYQCIVSLNNASAGSIVFYFSPSGICNTYNQGSVTLWNNTSSFVNDGKYHHFTFTIHADTGNITLFVDSINFGTISMSGLSYGWDIAYLGIGCDAFYSSKYSKQIVKMFRFYNRVLLDTEITQNFNSFVPSMLATTLSGEQIENYIHLTWI